MTASERQPTVIIGVGNPLRRDDGVGPLLLDALRFDPVPGCDLVELDGETTRVIEAWRDRTLAIVVDAICAGDEAGTIHDLTIDQLHTIQLGAVATSSHAAGVAEALALGRKLGRLPETLRVMGIEPGDLKFGPGLSPPVAESIEELIERVRTAVRSQTEDRVDT